MLSNNVAEHVCVRIWCDWTGFENSSKTNLGTMWPYQFCVSNAIRFAQLQNECNCFHSMCYPYILLRIVIVIYVYGTNTSIYIIVMQKQMSKLIAIVFVDYSIRIFNVHFKPMEWNRSTTTMNEYHKEKNLWGLWFLTHKNLVGIFENRLNFHTF